MSNAKRFIGEDMCHDYLWPADRAAPAAATTFSIFSVTRGGMPLPRSVITKKRGSVLSSSASWSGADSVLEPAGFHEPRARRPVASRLASMRKRGASSSISAAAMQGAVAAAAG